MSIIFTTTDRAFNYSIFCKKTDTIRIAKNKLYKENQEYLKDNIFFYCKGKVLEENKTFESMGIKNGDIIFIEKHLDTENIKINK